ncbi:MAG: 50S ribosomal protein L11 [Candidatus Njordarchaeota archaeon]
MGKKETLGFLVKGGEATPGPPLGPALGQHGLPVGKVVADINKLTAEYKGMRVPIEIIFDPDTRKYEIKVGTPYTSALIMKYAKIDKGSGKPNSEFVGNITLEQVIEIAKTKKKDMIAKNFLSCVKQVIGTCVSMGVKVENMDPREVIKNIESILKDKGLLEQVLKEPV